jgi:hypothetical protein
MLLCESTRTLCALEAGHVDHRLPPETLRIARQSLQFARAQVRIRAGRCMNRRDNRTHRSGCTPSTSRIQSDIGPGLWQLIVFQYAWIEPEKWTGREFRQVPTPDMESEMARHQPQSHIALARRASLVIVLLGTLPGCSSDSTANNAVDASAENHSVPRVNPVPAPPTALATSTPVVSVPDPSPSEPVTAVMTIQPERASVGETIELLVHIRIASAHFVHAKDDAGGPFVPLTVNSALPEEVEPIGDWRVPTPEKGRGNSQVFRSSVVLRRLLKVVSGSAPATLTVTGELEYQVCTDELCWPRGTLKLSAPLVIQSQPR